MPALFHAPSVDPDAVTAEDIAAILAKHNIRTDQPVPADFFQSGVTYHHNGDTFRCLASGRIDSDVVALGLLPVNLAGERTWEFGYTTQFDWRRGWTADATPTTNTTRS